MATQGKIALLGFEATRASLVWLGFGAAVSLPHVFTVVQMTVLRARMPALTGVTAATPALTTFTARGLGLSGVTRAGVRLTDLKGA